MTTKIALLNNPKALQNRQDPLLSQKLEKILGTQGKMYQSNSLSELTEICQQILANHCEILVINGGDGTLSRTLSELINLSKTAVLPKIVPLCGGTMNTVAFGLGLKDKPQVILKQLIDKIESETPLPLRVINILKVEQQFGFIFGSGCFARFIEIYRKSDRPTPWRAIKLLLKTIIALIIKGPFYHKLFRSENIELAINQQKEIVNCLQGIFAATVDHVGFGFKPFKLVRTKQDIFQLLIIKEPLIRIILKIFELYRGIDSFDKTIISRSYTNCQLRYPTQQIFMLDGELHTATDKINLSCGPKIEFILPAG